MQPVVLTMPGEIGDKLYHPGLLPCTASLSLQHLDAVPDKISLVGQIKTGRPGASVPRTEDIGNILHGKGGIA